MISAILQLPEGHDISSLLQEAQRLLRLRRRFLHRRGDFKLSALEIEGSISRDSERRRGARQRLNRQYDPGPVDTGTYLGGLLSDYNSDTEEPDEADPAEATSSVPPAEKPSAKSRDKAATSGAPVLSPAPRGKDIASGTFLDTCCQVCSGKHFNQSSHQIATLLRRRPPSQLHWSEMDLSC